MIAFCLALASVAFWPALPSPWVSLWLGVTALGCLGWPAGRVVAPALVGLCWGILWGHWGLEHRLPAAWEGEDLMARGVVIGLPRQDGDRCRFDIQLEALYALGEHASSEVFAPRRIRLSHYHCAEPFLPGKRYALQVRLKRPRGFRNPGGFDYEGYLFARAIDATGYVRGAPQALAGSSFDAPVDRLRWALARGIDEAVGNAERAGLLRALLLGDKRGISEHQWQLLRNSGTVHLVVISGLHIGLVAMAVYLLLKTLLARACGAGLVASRHWAVAFALLAACGYALLAGFTLPTQRALVMVATLLLALAGWRRLGASRRLLIALCLVLMIDPLAVRSAGFWLSFGATGVLLYLFCGRLARPPRLEGALAAQLAIFAGLAPGLALFFYQVPWVAPLVNLLAIPLVSLLVLPLALASLVLCVLDTAWGTQGLSGAGVLLGWGMEALVWVDAHSDAWRPGAPGLAALGLAVLGVGLLLLPRGVTLRWLAPLLWLPLLLPSVRDPPAGHYQVTVLDVGQGLAVLVETAEHRLLYDTGPRFASGFTAAEAAVVPYLQQRRIRRLDRMVISHADSDHAGGRAVVASALAVDSLWDGADCRVGADWQWDGVEFRVLHPGPQPQGNENNRSCVLLVDNGQEATLLTGDIEAAVESSLVERWGTRLRADNLVAPHHGSRSSSSALFLGQVLPRRVFFSAGYRNHYGHPHSEVVRRYRQVGAVPYATGRSGALTLQVGPERGDGPSAYRREGRRYWWE